jgi:hypothetical protein
MRVPPTFVGPAVRTGEGPGRDLAMKHFCSLDVLRKQKVEGRGPS